MEEDEYNDIINILPLVEGVMVDYHTRGKYHTLEKEYHPRRSRG
jgi:hypothetical protein